MVHSFQDIFDIDVLKIEFELVSNVRVTLSYNKMNNKYLMLESHFDHQNSMKIAPQLLVVEIM